jgi:ribosomal protein L18E
VKESIDDFMHQRDVAIKAAEERGDLDTSEEYTFNRSKDSVEEVRSINPFTGIAFVNIYNKSFMTEINQAPVQTKTYYNELKNELLSYQWTKGETNVDRSNVVNNRLIVAKLEVENDTLVTYFALNPNNFKGVQTASGEKYRTTPLKFFVRNDEDAERAKSFVAVLAEKFGKGRDAHHKDMMFVDESDSANSKATAKTEHDFKTQGDASVCEEFGMLYYLDEVENMHQDEVSATVADEMIHDEVAFTLVEHLRRDGKRSGKKCIVNIDTISSRFEKGDLVNLETMKKKGIIAKNIGYVKVLARGKLNKPLTIEAQDFSMAAVKMVVLTGGTAREV